MRRRTGRLIGAAAAAVVAAGGITAAVAATDGADGAGGVKVPASSSADAGFARDMAIHHQQAVEMSYIVRDRTENEEIRRLAYDIAQTQANQRGMLLGWVDLWELPKVSEGAPMAWMGMAGMEPGKDGALMPGMATNTELSRLGKLSGRAAEVRFLQLMIDHHEGGIHMAEGCVERCETKAELRLAQGMVDSQKSEVKLMADLLTARGAKR